jgi:L-ascorbate metabolism protein UlaG (beta-lactamase superfamily)
MRVRWLGHSCFLITSGRGIKILTDPYGKNVSYTLPKVAPDIVTLSHHHFDHNAYWRAEGNPRIVKRTSDFYEEHEVNVKGESVKFKGIPTYHDTSLGKKKGPNTILVWSLDDIYFCFLGDLGHIPSEKEYETMGKVDVLFVPVGGLTTIAAKEASDIVNRLSPSLVFPMHFKTEFGGEALCNILSDDVSIFLARMRDVRKLDTDSFNFNPADIKEASVEGTRVYSLTYIPSEE